MSQVTSLDSLRLLLIEDSIPVRERIRSMLEETSIVEIVGETGTVDEAITLFDSLRPDAVLLDLNLADEDGTKVLLEIKRRQPTCVVIVLTNFAIPESKERCLKAGAEYFLDKSREYEHVPQILRNLYFNRKSCYTSDQAKEIILPGNRTRLADQDLSRSTEAEKLPDAMTQWVIANARKRAALESKTVGWQGSMLKEGFDAHSIASIADARGKITYVNDQFCTVSGYTRKELIEQNHRMINPGHHPKNFVNELLTTVSHGRIWHGILRNTAKDGSFYWLETCIVPFLNAQGEPIQYVSIHTDITRQQQAEAARAKIENQFRMIFERAPVGLALMNMDFCWLQVNQQLCDMVGYAAEELLQQNLRDITHPGDVGADLALVNNLVTGKIETYAATRRLIRKNGSLVLVNLSFSLLNGATGEPKHFILTIEDVTGRKAAEGELKRQAAFVHDNPNPVLELAATGAVNYCNGATREMALSLKQERPESLMPAHTASLVRECLTTGKPVLRVETQIEDRIISWSYFPVPENQTVYCYAGDITERKQLEQHAHHGQRLEVIGTLASGVIHDLNNLLTPMLMVAGLLRDKLPADEDQRLLSLLETGAQRGARIANQLLVFSRNNVGPFLPVHLDRVTKELALLIEETFPKNIRFECDVPEQLFPVMADVTQIHQVVMNLCVNARDAMTDGGTLRLNARNTSLSEDDVRPFPGGKAGRYVVLTVTDTGHGIPPEIVRRIFDPFFTTKENGKGTGLGLSTVAAIVKNHNGFIMVQSKMNSGTAFKVYLPAAAEGTVIARNSTGPIKSRGKRELILVVDDDDPIRELMRLCLEKQNYRVLAAANGEEAIKLFVQQGGNIKLLLTDMVMPGMDGLALARALRVMSSTLKVIVCSGADQTGRQKEFQSLGVLEILPKPFVIEQLMEAVSQAMGERHQ